MQMSTIAKGAMVGVAAGCVTCLVAGNKRHNHRRTRMMQKKAEHAVKTIGNAMDELSGLIK